MPVSYKVLQEGKMADALNVASDENVLITRNGYTRYNSTQLHSTKEINSVSYFKDNSGTIRVLAKVQEDVYSVSTSGSHVLIEGGFLLDVDILDEDELLDGSLLTASNKHRAVTIRGRHIVAMGSNGLFSWDGTTWSKLGQSIPAALTATVSSGGSLLADTAYNLAYTFYDSTNGFETNIGAAVKKTTTSSNKTLSSISAVASDADNNNIDKVRIYLQDSTNNGSYLFIEEIALGATPTDISAVPTSSNTPPTKNAEPQTTGGMQYLAVFGNKIAASGNSTFPSDVFLSTADIPDGWDDTSSGLTIQSAGQGPVTGLGVGFYSGQQSLKVPFLCIFKRTSIEVYDATNGVSTISKDVGCVAHDTIQEINGAIYFMSTIGWHVIVNGRMQTDENLDAYQLADGDLKSIFTQTGFKHQLSKTNIKNAFSVYYPTLDQYMTFASTAGRTDFVRSFNYELDIGGFRPYEFPINIIDAALAEDSAGEDIILFATAGGYIMKHSIKENRADTLEDNTTQAIDAFFHLPWIYGEDFDATFNFGCVIFKALESGSTITARYFLDYQLSEPTLQTFDFDSDDSGFVLDLSKLDEGVLGDGRTVVKYEGEVLKTGQSLLVGFYQNVLNASMNMIRGQIDISKNGNPN